MPGRNEWSRSDERRRLLPAAMATLAAVLLIASVLLDEWWKMLTVGPAVVAIVTYLVLIVRGYDEKPVYPNPKDDR
jgi:hypothetical protein